ncbi:MAG: hypothetical protein EPO65_01055 [Dehalococcoidia bacterium]|nr:MAG: hypothetical protein EPO65_01055 [Dehalococcoidia bacterium]
MTRLSTRFSLPSVLSAFAVAVALLAGSSPRVASAALVVPPVFTAPIQATGLTETWTINGWQGSVPNHITSVTVTFPAGFVIPNNPTVTVTANALACTVRTAARTDQSVVIAVTGTCETSAAVGRQSITIAGVTNPTAAGTIAAAGFTLATNVDSETAASAGVTIWGITTNPTVCTTSAGVSTAEVTFVSTGGGVAANTGSGRAAALQVTLSAGSFRWTPFFTGTLGTIDTAGVTATTAAASVAAGVSSGSSLAVGLGLSGATVVTVTLRVTPATGGTSVLLGSREVTFTDSTCVAPATTPRPPSGTAGTFSGGTIAASGVSIVSFSGTTAQLDTAGAAAKVTSVSATASGRMLTFVVGAPSFVNADFNAAFPIGLSSTLVIVKT